MRFQAIIGKWTVEGEFESRDAATITGFDRLTYDGRCIVVGPKLDAYLRRHYTYNDLREVEFVN